MSESNGHLPLKTGRKYSLQKAPPRWEVAQTLKGRTEMLLSVPYVSPVIVPDILPPEYEWKDICFLSDISLHQAMGSCSLSPLSLTASTSGEGKEKNQEILHGQCGLCRDCWWDTQNQSCRFRLYCQQVSRYLEGMFHVEVYEAKSPGCYWVAGW